MVAIEDPQTQNLEPHAAIQRFTQGKKVNKLRWNLLHLAQLKEKTPWELPHALTCNGSKWARNPLEQKHGPSSGKQAGRWREWGPPDPAML